MATIGAVECIVTVGISTRRTVVFAIIEMIGIRVVIGVVIATATISYIAIGIERWLIILQRTAPALGIGARIPRSIAAIAIQTCATSFPRYPITTRLLAFKAILAIAAIVARLTRAPRCPRAAIASAPSDNRIVGDDDVRLRLRQINRIRIATR